MVNPDKEPQLSPRRLEQMPTRHDNFLEEFGRKLRLITTRRQAQPSAEDTVTERKQRERAVIKAALKEDLEAGFIPRERSDNT